MSRKLADATADRIADLRSQLADCLLRDQFNYGRQLDQLEKAKNAEAIRESCNRISKRIAQSKSSVLARRESLPHLAFPEELPVCGARDQLIEALQKHPVIIVAGETGSGKTTQIPKICLAAGLGTRGRIGCTQPRRIAALTVSRRIAEELQVPWGGFVGAAIRFQDRTAPETVIKLMTDGILLNELQRDPLLTDYEAIIVDEAHERSLNIDFIIGFLRRLRSQRPELRIVITSATIDTSRFSEAFGNAPVFEVSGRLYPVDIEYRPLNPEESDDVRYDSVLDAVVGVTSEIIEQYPPGDLLVFLSGERAIRETVELLEGRRFRDTDVLPLFGRLASQDQEAIFRPGSRRRIIVATNIAETSVTIPRIRYVVDTGFARLSRYSPHTRTRRLPIEPISQSSASQRAGRCGRVQAGVCFRLYSEDDLVSRPEHTPPEIQRSNLASVILQLLAMRIQDLESFPFLDPPAERAIRGGLSLLRELKAVDDRRHLTPLGHKLARLTVDPTIGAMLLHAPRETCLREILVIAAGMSIQDPRERPADHQTEADQAHRQFLHPQSDFLTLLAIWNTYTGKSDQLTRNQLKRWCRSQYLSYLRMREWQDLHRQLHGILKDLDALRLHDDPADERSIHRAILTGLIGNVAHKTQGNHYLATHGRKVMLFPGSTLFDKRAARPREKKTKTAPVKSATPEWILCGEWLETTRLYARTAAAIDRRWIVDLGSHLFRESISEPAWDRTQGRVIAKRRLLLYGLEIETHIVSYARVDPDRSREWFIRSGLIEMDIENPPRWMDQNLAVRQQLEAHLTRTRRAGAASLEELLYSWFSETIKDAAIGSIGDLNHWFKEDPARREALLLNQEKLVALAGAGADARAFPTRLEIGDSSYPLDYHFQPGKDTDGATLRMPIGHFESLREGMLDWVVPGYIEEKVQALLRALPKTFRVKLHPLAETAGILLGELRPSPEPLLEQLHRLIGAQFQLEIPMETWRSIGLPAHLQVRVELVDEKDQTLAESRQWRSLEEAYSRAIQERQIRGIGAGRSRLWKQAAAGIEHDGLREWTFDDLPESISLGELAGVPVIAWPGLQREPEPDTVALRLFRTRAEAGRHTRPALRRLAENCCARDLAWLKKDLKILSSLGPLVAPFAPPAAFFQQAEALVIRTCFAFDEPLPLRREVFSKQCEDAVRSMRGLPHGLHDQLKLILELRNELASKPGGYPGLATDLLRLVPPDFLARVRFQQLPHLLRYLRGLEVRALRYAANPEKDRNKAGNFLPFQNRLDAILRDPPDYPDARAKLNNLFWLVEEFRVSTFAQELGTSQKVSQKAIETALQNLSSKPGLPG